jgi:2-amino-4-hydroxy-6-hydroxymethyldihydropteridine diphosphokinase
MSFVKRAFIGLGSNQGDRLLLLRRAVRLLGAAAEIEVRACSSVYRTAPLGPILDQPEFLNAVCEISTSLAPRALLGRLLSIEAELGRRREQPGGPRTMDLDLLLYEDLILDEPDLTVPHPRLAERAFVVMPLAEIAPDLRHPASGEPVSSIRERLRGQHIQALDPAARLV